VLLGIGGCVAVAMPSAARMPGVLFASGIIGLACSSSGGLGVAIALVEIVVFVRVLLALFIAEYCTEGISRSFRLQAAARITIRQMSAKVLLCMFPLV
jgi:uncharacterized membrane protein